MEILFWIILGFALGLFVYHKWFHIIDDGVEWIKGKFGK
jgi:hypothetical protein|tara:strand:- start:187 stop:303 length:117 start_codon:yes stop_codon:yes gene_type:complete